VVRTRIDESFKSEDTMSISLLFARSGLKLQLVILLVMFNGIAISASAQGTAHSSSCGRRPVAQGTVSPDSPGDCSQDEYVDLKLSSSVRHLAHLVGLSPETAFRLCEDFNFLLMLALLVWKGGPLLRSRFQERSKSIRLAIDEAHRLSEDARKRLVEVEKRWAQLDSAIAAMQAAAEEQMENEEKALAAQTAEETRRIWGYAQLEMDNVARRARHELKVFAADLAVSLARQSMRIDESIDQELIQGFTNQLEHRQATASTTTEVSMQAAKV
jgi:F0F1-type ATP synthase membrane subunit b/b'